MEKTNQSRKTLKTLWKARGQHVQQDWLYTPDLNTPSKKDHSVASTTNIHQFSLLFGKIKKWTWRNSHFTNMRPDSETACVSLQGYNKIRNHNICWSFQTKRYKSSLEHKKTGKKNSWWSTTLAVLEFWNYWLVQFIIHVCSAEQYSDIVSSNGIYYK